MPRIKRLNNDGICSDCMENYIESMEMMLLPIFPDCLLNNGLERLDSPIYFKDKKHLFKNCTELEQDMASETTE
jgi:hypothetical protein